MVKIRLQRVGARNQPKYRIVVIESKVKRDGAYLELLGDYDPTVKPAKISLKRDRFNWWLEKGAKSSLSVLKLLDILEGKETNN